MDNYLEQLIKSLEAYIDEYIEDEEFDKERMDIINKLYHELQGAISYAYAREDLTKEQAKEFRLKADAARFEKFY